MLRTRQVDTVDFVTEYFPEFSQAAGTRKTERPAPRSPHFGKSVLSLGTLDLNASFSVQNFTNIFDKIH